MELLTLKLYHLGLAADVFDGLGILESMIIIAIVIFIYIG